MLLKEHSDLGTTYRHIQGSDMGTRLLNETHQGMVKFHRDKN